MALRKAILGVSATGVAAGGLVLGKVGAWRNVLTFSLETYTLFSGGDSDGEGDES